VGWVAMIILKWEGGRGFNQHNVRTTYCLPSSVVGILNVMLRCWPHFDFGFWSYKQQTY